MESKTETSGDKGLILQLLPKLDPESIEVAILVARDFAARFPPRYPFAQFRPTKTV